VQEIRGTQEDFMMYHFAAACRASVHMIMNANQTGFWPSEQVKGERRFVSLNMASMPADGISSVFRMVVDPFSNTPVHGPILGMDHVLET
jgi:hypothetical protein